jgi:hypothetical protein
MKLKLLVIVIAAFMAFGLALMWPSRAAAQAPDYCTNNQIIVTVDFSDNNPLTVYELVGGPVTSMQLSQDYFYSSPNSLRIDKTIGSGSSPHVKYLVPVYTCPVTQTVSFSGRFLIVAGDSSGFWVSALYEDGTQIDDLAGTCPPRLYGGSGGSLVQSCSFSAQSTPDNPIVGFVLNWLWYVGTSGIENFNQTAYLDDLVIDFSAGGAIDEPVGVDLCTLVDDPGFTGLFTNTWLLDGNAVITDSTLILGPGDIAAQNLILEANTTYNAVISATQVSTSTPLNVVLSFDNEVLDIPEPGRYTATFTTPTNLNGPAIYGLENQGDGTITIDFTCVSLDTNESGQVECLAPLNGEFDDESHWNWYRGAEWFSPGAFASLPLADLGMIGSTETYTMPAITGTERLLLGFTARGLAENGVISGQVTNGGSTAEFNFSTYLAEYSYETSLDALAQETGVQFSFVNPSDVITGVVSSADVVVDNICVFVANRGPNLPTPTDPDGITPIELGFNNYTSCDDVDGLLAGFGVNIQQYRAEYLAGASIWDPIGWVPWLIAAMWNILATWFCIFMAAFVSFVDMLEYLINNFLNIGNWGTRMVPLLVAWLGRWLLWFYNSLLNFSLTWETLTDWLAWVGNGLWAMATTIALTLVAAIQWFWATLTNILTAVTGFLVSWFTWGAESVFNLGGWLWNELGTLNGLRIIANWLIGGWNGFLVALGVVLSLILDDLIGIWNSSLWPFLADVWSWIAQMPITIVGLLIDFIIAAWDLLIMMFWWAWENIISVASTPLTFYRALDEGVNADPYNLVSCVGENFWCTFLAGVQLINQLIAHSIFYPIIIVGIILSTLWVIWDNMLALFSPVEIK